MIVFLFRFASTSSSLKPPRPITLKAVSIKAGIGWRVAYLSFATIGATDQSMDIRRMFEIWYGKFILL